MNEYLSSAKITPEDKPRHKLNAQFDNGDPSIPTQSYASARLTRFFLLLFYLLIASTAQAAEYSWNNHFFQRYGYPSPSAVCYKLGGTADNSTYNVIFTTPTSGYCQKSTSSKRCSYCGFYRAGNNCPADTTYNATSGECAKDEQKGQPAPQACAGNPINIANGNKFQKEIDYSHSGPSNLSFARSYNSLDGLWRHNYSTHLRITSFAVALVTADGRESFFTVDSNDSPITVTPSPSELGQLAKAGDTWSYTTENNDIYSFDAIGRLTRWSNITGTEHLLSYNNGTITVTDNFGQNLSFTEDAQHQPLTLTAAGITIQYEYNTNKRLIKLTRTHGGQTEQRQFHYENVRGSALLTGITDERGVRFATWTFDDKGRATSSEHADGVEPTQVTYNADGSSTVTNELGKDTIYRFVSIGGIKRVSAIEGQSSANCPNSNSTFTYDERGLLKTKTDNKGHLTTVNYNERGLEVSRTEAAGTPQARTITTDWHPEFFLPVSVTEPDRIIQYTYDAQGRQLSQSVTQR